MVEKVAEMVGDFITLGASPGTLPVEVVIIVLQSTYFCCAHGYAVVGDIVFPKPMSSLVLEVLNCAVHNPVTLTAFFWVGLHFRHEPLDDDMLGGDLLAVVAAAASDTTLMSCSMMNWMREHWPRI